MRSSLVALRGTGAEGKGGDAAITTDAKGGTGSAVGRASVNDVDPPILRGGADDRFWLTAAVSETPAFSAISVRASRLPPPAEQLLRAQAVAPRHLRHVGAGPLGLSMMMRALSSSDHCRRRPECDPGPVITSIRRTIVTASSPPSPGFVSSVRSSLWSNRSLMARHQATARARPERGGGAPLTLEPTRHRCQSRAFRRGA